MTTTTPPITTPEAASRITFLLDGCLDHTEEDLVGSVGQLERGVMQDFAVGGRQYINQVTGLVSGDLRADFLMQGESFAAAGVKADEIANAYGEHLVSAVINEDTDLRPEEFPDHDYYHFLSATMGVAHRINTGELENRIFASDSTRSKILAFGHKTKFLKTIIGLRTENTGDANEVLGVARSWGEMILELAGNEGPARAANTILDELKEFGESR